MKKQIYINASPKFKPFYDNLSRSLYGYKKIVSSDFSPYQYLKHYFRKQSFTSYSKKIQVHNLIDHIRLPGE